MNNIKRLLYGVFSTLLLAAGFARAATHFDPISSDMSRASIQETRLTDGPTGICLGDEEPTDGDTH